MRTGFSVALAAAALGVAVSAAQAAQPVIKGPYALFNVAAIYDIDYAVSTAAAPGQLQSTSDTIISIGLPDVTSAAAGCQAQVDWFDWDGFPAGLSGPDSPATPIVTLVPGQTLEFTTSRNSANPNEYPPFTENVFRDITNPKGSKLAFEGRAEIRVMCVPGTVAPTALRVDAEVVTAERTPSGQLSFTYKPINVTRTTGLVGK